VPRNQEQTFLASNEIDSKPRRTSGRGKSENMTKEQAIKMGKSKWWLGLNSDVITAFQLFEEKLCMNFSDFHKAIEESLGRPVYTHEFGLNLKGLQEEFLGKRPKATLEEILDLIPPEKKIFIANY